MHIQTVRRCFLLYKRVVCANPFLNPFLYKYLIERHKDHCNLYVTGHSKIVFQFQRLADSVSRQNARSHTVGFDHVEYARFDGAAPSWFFCSSFSFV